MIEIYENFASKYLKLDIESVILSSTFPWNFHDQTSDVPPADSDKLGSILEIIPAYTLAKAYQWI
jgi:hypothetical protein